MHAYDYSQVPKAAPTVAVFLHSARATVEGGTIIDLTGLELDKASNWCEWNSVDVVDGKAILYKAVNQDLLSGYQFRYPIGETVTAPDWEDRDVCGYGLHFCPSPRQARDYNPSATRFLKVAVDIKVLRPISGDSTPKCKAKSADVLVEVDIDGAELVVEVAA